MAKMNLQAVSKFKPKFRDPRVNSVERVRMERFGQLDLPVEFTLDVGLIVVDDDSRMVQCSRHPSLFSYSVERMRWENSSSVQWTSTIICKAIAANFWHPAYTNKELMRVLLDEINLGPGMTLTIPAGSLTLDSTCGFDVRFPPEDYVITEEPDGTDWQEAFVKATGYKYKPRKKKRA